MASVNTIPAVDTFVGDKDRITAERTRLLNAKLRLFQSSFSPTPNSIQTEFVAAEATFTSYAGVVITWNLVALDSQGGWQVQGTEAFWQASDNATPNVIGGAWLETGAGALVEYWAFTPPISMEAALAQIMATPCLRWPEPDQLVVQW